MFDVGLKTKVQKILTSNGSISKAKSRLYTLLSSHNYQEEVDTDDIAVDIIESVSSKVAVPGNLLTALLLIGIVIPKEDIKLCAEKDMDYYQNGNKKYMFYNYSNEFEIFCNWGGNFEKNFNIGLCNDYLVNNYESFKRNWGTYFQK